MIGFLKQLLRPQPVLSQGLPKVDEIPSDLNRQQRRYQERKRTPEKVNPKLVKAGEPRFKYGNTIVPIPAMWSEEEEFFVGMCAYSKMRAICQKEAQGKGVPRFGRPHAMRQRKMLVLGLCDICGKPLKYARKISLSAYCMKTKGGENFTQMEPLLHEECARLSLDQCPALQRQREAHQLQVKEVFNYRAKMMFATEDDVERMIPDYIGPKLVGLGVIELLAWKDVSEEFFSKVTVN